MSIVPCLILLFMVVFALMLLAIGTRRPPRPLTEIEKDYDDGPRSSAP